MPFNIPTLDEILGQYGTDLRSLMDPGAQFGYGNIQNSPYAEFFSPYNVQQFDQARTSLGQLQQGLLSDVRDQYSQSFGNLQSNIAGKMAEARGQQGKSGFSGFGAMNRYGSDLSQAGSEQLQKFKTGRTSSLLGVEESIGSKYGQLAGTIGSFLRGREQQALNIKQSDPTGGASGQFADKAFIEEVRSGLPEWAMSVFDDYIGSGDTFNRQEILNFVSNITSQAGG